VIVSIGVAIVVVDVLVRRMHREKTVTGSAGAEAPLPQSDQVIATLRSRPGDEGPGRCFREASICVPQADYIGRVAQLARGSTVSRRRLPEMGQRAAEAPAGFVLLSLLC
jgi:hypothetical protein